MPLHETLQRQLHQTAPAQLLEGTVLDPPLDASGQLRVEVDDQPGVAFACPWMPRQDVAVAAGDAVVVQESDRGTYWVVAWWSQSGEVPSGLAEHEALESGVHGLPDTPTLGRGVVWNGSGWDVAPDFAAELAAHDARLDALEALTPFVRIHRTTQAVTAGAWNIVQWDTIIEEQNLDDSLSLVASAPHHVLVEAAGVYHVQTDINWSVGTNDHLVFVGVNTSAQAITAGAALKEAIQQRLGPLSNTALSVAGGPLLLDVGDKIHVQVFQTTAQNMTTGNLRIAKIGP